MIDFEPKKGKALMRAITQEANLKSERVVGLLADKWPEMATVLGVLQSSFGIRLAYKQELLNQFTEYIMANTDVFTADVLASPELHDGLIIAVGSYFKLRTNEKRKLAEKIFYDFGKSHDKPLYPLERYVDTLEKISQSGIRLLGFIENEIPRIKTQYAEAKMHTNNNDTVNNSREQWIEIYTGNEPLSTFIEEYIKENARKEAANYTNEMQVDNLQKFEVEKRDDISLVIGELEQLGLARSFHRSGGWGGGEDGYNLNDYGAKFISVIKPGDSAKPS